MADLLPEYEQQFATITAEITSKICLLGNKESGNVSPSSIAELETLMEEAKDLLESMDLEVRECLDSTQKPKLGHRVQSHKVEFSRLQSEYTRAREKKERTELLGGAGNAMYNGSGYSDDMHQQLLQDSDKLELTSARLTRSYQVALETEAIGAEILTDLHGQRTTIQHARDRLREADHELDSSSRVLGGMIRRALQTRFVAAAAVGLVLLVILIAIYVSFR